MRISVAKIPHFVHVPEEKRATAERLLESFSKGYPGYQPIKGCIDVNWTATLDQPMNSLGVARLVRYDCDIRKALQ